MTAAYDTHIVNTLLIFYLDPNCTKIFSDMWGTWMIATGRMEEYFYMMMKSDAAIAELTNRAKAQAQIIKNSPLSKAMQED